MQIFENSVFILNTRIKLLGDLLQLDTDISLFSRQTMTDLEFLNSTLGKLTETFVADTKPQDKEQKADYLSDTEWQFSQLLNKMSNNTSPFARYSEILGLIAKLKEESKKRQRRIEVSYIPSERTTDEPVVSTEELNGLLGNIG